MNASKMFLVGFNSYKSVSVAAAAAITGMMLVWFYASVQNAEQSAEAAFVQKHRIEVTATRLVAANPGVAVASLGSDTQVR